MYRLKQIIDNAGSNRKIGAVEILDGVVFVHLDGVEYKHENHNWYQLCGEKWVNLQGGVPNYETTNEDNLLFDYFEEEHNKSV